LLGILRPPSGCRDRLHGSPRTSTTASSKTDDTQMPSQAADS
jgi:hypothetical protein